MSFSGELFDWNIFSRREVPFDVELASPALEMFAALQKSHAALVEAQQVVEHVREEYLAVLAQQAVLVAQLSAALDRYAPEYSEASLAKIHRSLRIIKDQMLDELKKGGLEIVIPLGKSFDEVADVVSVDGWRHHENFSAEVVAEVVEPIVTYRGDVVRRGRVLMGAPLEEARTVTAPAQVEQSAEGREE